MTGVNSLVLAPAPRSGSLKFAVQRGVYADPLQFRLRQAIIEPPSPPLSVALRSWRCSLKFLSYRSFAITVRKNAPRGTQPCKSVS